MKKYEFRNIKKRLPWGLRCSPRNHNGPGLSLGRVLVLHVICLLSTVTILKAEVLLKRDFKYIFFLCYKSLQSLCPVHECLNFELTRRAALYSVIYFH